MAAGSTKFEGSAATLRAGVARMISAARRAGCSFAAAVPARRGGSLSKPRASFARNRLLRVLRSIFFQRAVEPVRARPIGTVPPSKLPPVLLEWCLCHGRHQRGKEFQSFLLLYALVRPRLLSCQPDTRGAGRAGVRRLTDRRHQDRPRYCRLPDGRPWPTHRSMRCCKYVRAI
ncbi:MAG: hypothetical protein KatS3mg112_0815 [Thermogutta sp.]|nr:MAG: hypothetical protein KatS3mg112_0815 [Thermogutta sp.]